VSAVLNAIVAIVLIINFSAVGCVLPVVRRRRRPSGKVPLGSRA
jgi:predicted secreted protein